MSILTSTRKDEVGDWFNETWGFAKRILPLLFWRVLVAGLSLARPAHGGLIPSEWVSQAVGGNSLESNLFASVTGAFMYFATLTEVPILQGLIGAGMAMAPPWPYRWPAGLQPAQHAGYPEHQGQQENGGLRIAGHRHGHDHRPDIRYYPGRMNGSLLRLCCSWLVRCPQDYWERINRARIGEWALNLTDHQNMAI